MKKLLIGIFAVASVITAASCSKSDSSSTAPSTKAGVMFVNGSAGTTPLDVTVNGAAITEATNLAYLKGTGYLNVTAGTDTVALLYHSTGTIFKGDTTAFTAGATYSVFAGGLINPATVIVTSDDLSAPTNGNAKVRFINLSPDTFHLSVVIGVSTLVSGLSTGQVSAFINIPAGSSTLTLGDPGNLNSNVTLSGQTFTAGKIYTIMYTGTLNGSSSVALAATVLNNN